MSRSNLLSCLLLATAFSSAESPEVAIGPNRRVGDTKTLQAEPYIAAHPTDAENLIVSVSEVKGREIVARAHVTLDGGRSWSQSRLPQMDEATAAGKRESAIDNWITYGADGIAYYSTLWQPPREGASIVVYRSQDKGRTWSEPVELPGKAYDQPRTIAATKKGDKTLYVATALGDKACVLLSSDGGLSFQTVATFAPSNLAHQPKNPLLLMDGSLLIPFTDYPSGSRQPASSRVYVVVSEDGGRTFTPPRFVADVPRSFPGGGVHFATDLSQGRFAGRVYAVWDSGDFGPRVRMAPTFSREETGSRREISVSYSNNKGRTWSAPKTLAHSGAGPAYFGTSAVAPNGTLGVFWIQHEKYETNPLCYRTYFSASVDGGDTFFPPRAVSDAVSCPNRPELEKIAYFRTRYRGGDYIGLAAAANSTFHAVWIDARDGGFVTYAAAIHVKVPLAAGSSAQAGVL